MTIQDELKELQNIPVLIPVTRLRYEGGFTTEYLMGEFTGYSFILGKYCFSLYNGETAKLDHKEFKFVFPDFK